jgi:hypothetical protein
MAKRSRGRGVAAAFGFLLLVAGLIGAGILYVMSVQRPDDAVESFARAAAGCTTTLDFSETGTFYVYEETTSAFDPAVIGCTPTPTVGQPFGFTLTGPVAVTSSPDPTVFYDSGDFAGASVARFDIDTPGTYEIEVVSENVSSVAAVGRDPENGVDELRRNAIVVGAIGVILGLLLLLLAGRRSKQATAPSMPDGPGWGPRASERQVEWPPSMPEVQRLPINPQQPDVPVSPTPPPPPLPARAPGAGLTAPSWSPPPTDGRPVSSEAPVPPPPTRTPQPIPVLPESEGTASGAWPASTPTPPPPPGSPPPPPPPGR